MTRPHVHFLRLNPVTRRAHSAPVDAVGVSGLLLLFPTLLFWTTWGLSALGMERPFEAVFTAEFLHRRILPVFVVGLPLAALFLGLASFLRRRRRSDLGAVIMPLSLLLLGAGILFSLIRLFQA